MYLWSGLKKFLLKAMLVRFVVFILKRLGRTFCTCDSRQGRFACIDTGEIVMDNVFVPEENAFPEIRGLRDHLLVK